MGQTPSQELNLELNQLFKRATEAFLVFNGTGANVLALKGLLQPYQSVICSEHSHINQDECAAPEAVGGIKLIAIECPHAKLTPERIEPYLIRRGDQHFAQPGALSITQPTEYGTLYSLKELRALTKLARSHNLQIHMDGARFILAAERLGCGWDELTEGIDVLSLGGTKNGLMMGEVVCLFNSQLRHHYKFLRKQLMQLPSKTRYLAAQFQALLKDELWREIARNSCQMALHLAQGLSRIPGVTLTQPVQANAVFCCLPQHVISELRKEFFFYVWDEKRSEVRLMTSFDTTLADVEAFLTTLNRLVAL